MLQLLKKSIKYQTYSEKSTSIFIRFRILTAHIIHVPTSRRVIHQASALSKRNIRDQYHQTSGVMQILHFDWLRYQGTKSNSHRVAKFPGFSLVFFPHLLSLLLPFCPTSWVILKQLDPSPSRATALIVKQRLGTACVNITCSLLS